MEWSRDGFVQLKSILDIFRNDPRIAVVKLKPIQPLILQFNFQLLTCTFFLLPISLLRLYLCPIVTIDLLHCFKNKLFKIVRFTFQSYVVKITYLHIYIVLLNYDVQFQHTILKLVWKKYLFVGSSFDIQLMITQIDKIDVIAYFHYRLLHNFLADYQLPKIHHTLKFLNHLLKTHLLKILVKFNILHHHRKTNRFTRLQHQMPDQVQYLCWLLLTQKLHENYCDSCQLGFHVGWHSFLF